MLAGSEGSAREARSKGRGKLSLLPLPRVALGSVPLHTRALFPFPFLFLAPSTRANWQASNVAQIFSFILGGKVVVLITIHVNTKSGIIDIFFFIKTISVLTVALVLVVKVGQVVLQTPLLISYGKLQKKENGFLCFKPRSKSVDLLDLTV